MTGEQPDKNKLRRVTFADQNQEGGEETKEDLREDEGDDQKDQGDNCGDEHNKEDIL